MLCEGAQRRSDLPLCCVEIAHLHRTCDAPQVQVSPPSVVRNDRPDVDFAAALGEAGEPGRLLGVGNGNPTDYELFQSYQRRAFGGLCLAILQSTTTPGTVEVSAAVSGLTTVTAIIQTQ
jgi:hypothetical protein